MSELVKDIMRALPDDFVRRMRNWARFKTGSSLGYATVDLENGTAGGYREARIPILSGEGEDTDRALQTLDVRYRRAVELWWAWEDTEITVLARRCGGIDKKTYAKRVMDGHVFLRGELACLCDAYKRMAAQAGASQIGVRRALDETRIPV